MIQAEDLRHLCNQSMSKNSFCSTAPGTPGVQKKNDPVFISNTTKNALSQYDVSASSAFI